MGDRKKIGPKVDSTTWQQFRQYVQDKHGQTREYLARELEAALEERMHTSNGPDPVERIEADVADLKRMIAEMEADGSGAPRTASGGQDTHTQTDTPSKPSAKASRDAKRRWLTDLVRCRYDGQVRRADIAEIVRDEYGFRADTTDDYVDDVLQALEAAQHPSNPNLWLWGQALIEARETAAEDAHDDAIQETARIADADPID